MIMASADKGVEVVLKVDSEERGWEIAGKVYAESRSAVLGTLQRCRPPIGRTWEDLLHDVMFELVGQWQREGFRNRNWVALIAHRCVMRARARRYPGALQEVYLTTTRSGATREIAQQQPGVASENWREMFGVVCAEADRLSELQRAIFREFVDQVIRGGANNASIAARVGTELGRELTERGVEKALARIRDRLWAALFRRGLVTSKKRPRLSGHVVRTV